MADDKYTYGPQTRRQHVLAARAASPIGVNGGIKPVEVVVRATKEEVEEREAIEAARRELVEQAERQVEDILESRRVIGRTILRVAENLSEIAEFPTAEEEYYEGGNVTILKPANVAENLKVAQGIEALARVGNLLLGQATEIISVSVPLPDDLSDAELEAIVVGSPEGRKIIEALGVVERVGATVAEGAE